MRLKWWSSLPSLLNNVVSSYKYTIGAEERFSNISSSLDLVTTIACLIIVIVRTIKVYTNVQSEKKHKDIFFYVHIKCFSYSWSFLKWWNGDAVPGDWHGFESSCIGLVLEGIGFGVDFPWPSSLGAVAAFVIIFCLIVTYNVILCDCESQKQQKYKYLKHVMTC